MTAMLSEALDAPRRAQAWLVMALVVINGIVAVNAYLHPPQVGYDATEHLRYVAALARGRIPTPADTFEYHSPPLAYAIPAGAVGVGLMSVAQSGKLAQVVNVLLSIGLTLFVLRTCQVMRPGDGWLKGLALGFLGGLPVYYKIFSQLRGDTWVAFLTVALVCQVLLAVTRERIGVSRAAGIGLCAGLLVLARQWGMLVVVAAALFGALVLLRRPDRRGAVLRAVAVAALVAAATAGWYVAHLGSQYGTVRVFNRTAPGFSLWNQDRDFYFGMGRGRLFTKPVRKEFGNQMLPILYADTWGDYWYYFLVRGEDARTGAMLAAKRLHEAITENTRPVASNRTRMAKYLGRVNVAALVPSACLLAGAILGWAQLARIARQGSESPRVLGGTLSGLVVAVFLAGYGWFMVTFANAKGDAMRAAHMVHIFPLLAILAADALILLRARSRGAFGLTLVLLALATLHNTPALVTRYGVFSREQVRAGCLEDLRFLPPAVSQDPTRSPCG